MAGALRAMVDAVGVVLRAERAASLSDRLRVAVYVSTLERHQDEELAAKSESSSD